MEAKKNSVIGNVSFLLSIVCLIVPAWLIFLLITVGEENLPILADLDPKSRSVVFFLVCYTSALPLPVSLLLGIAGLLQKGGEKIFAALGTLLSAVPLLIILLLFLLPRLGLYWQALSSS